MKIQQSTVDLLHKIKSKGDAEALGILQDALNSESNGRYKLCIDGMQQVIRDTKENENLFILTEGGHGVLSSTRENAIVVVDFLNRQQNPS